MTTVLSWPLLFWPLFEGRKKFSVVGLRLVQLAREIGSNEKGRSSLPATAFGETREPLRAWPFRNMQAEMEFPWPFCYFSVLAFKTCAGGDFARPCGLVH